MCTKTTFSHHWRYINDFDAPPIHRYPCKAVVMPTAIMIITIFNLTSTPPSPYTLRSNPLFRHRQYLTNFALHLPCPQSGHPVWTDQISGYLTKVFVVVGLQFARCAPSAYSCSHLHTAISLLLCRRDLFSCHACCGKGTSTNLKKQIKSSTSRYFPQDEILYCLQSNSHLW